MEDGWYEATKSDRTARLLVVGGRVAAWTGGVLSGFPIVRLGELWPPCAATLRDSGCKIKKMA